MTVTYWEIFFSCLVLWFMYEFFKCMDYNRNVLNKPEEEDKL